MTNVDYINFAVITTTILALLCDVFMYSQINGYYDLVEDKAIDNMLTEVLGASYDSLVLNAEQRKRRAVGNDIT